MKYSHEIVTALKRWGPLGLMNLRRKVCGQLGFEVPLAEIKLEVKQMRDAGELAVLVLKNGYEITLKEPYGNQETQAG